MMYTSGVSISKNNEWGFVHIMVIVVHSSMRPVFLLHCFGVFLVYGFCNEETPEWKCLWWIFDFSGGFFYFFVCD